MGYYVPNKVKPICYNCPYRTNKYCGLLTEHDYLGDYPKSYEPYPYCPLVEVADRKTENSSEKPNNFAKDINVRSKDEPQDDAEDQFCIEHNCPHFYQFGGCMNQGDCPYDEDEPQTEREGE